MLCFALLALLIYDYASSITCQWALSHPYFTDLNGESLPEISEEIAGLPTNELPHPIVMVCNDLLSVTGSESGLEAEMEKLTKEEREEEGEGEGKEEWTSHWAPAVVAFCWPLAVASTCI